LATCAIAHLRWAVAHDNGMILPEARELADPLHCRDPQGKKLRCLRWLFSSCFRPPSPARKQMALFP
jgi:hypothetical protein